jgi:glycosyltransferase involved in cell wall biosynthesis
MTLQRERADRGQVRTFGVVVDDFAVAAGATDFIVSLVDGLLLAAEGRKVVPIMRGSREECAGWIDRLKDAGLPEIQVVGTERTEAGLIRLCKQRKVDVVGPLYAPPGEQFPVPWIGYLYDFQHRHLPQWFTAEAIAERDATFRIMLERADAVVVHSQSVKHDAEHFFPPTKAKIFALPLSAARKSKWLSIDPRPRQQKYGIGSDYFLVSNQFWLHKRHETAIEAFADVAAKHPGVRLVLTGATEDWRAPTRRPDLEDLIARLGIANRVDILGFIPKRDQIAIMRGARAVIQPTAFEGAAGGHSVYDAISLGVPAIVSDIPVNREIANYVAAYFPLDDAAALAECMASLLAVTPSRPSLERLQREGRERRRHFGEQVWAAADYAARHFHPGG